jgi:hypothetical protein
MPVCYFKLLQPSLVSGGISGAYLNDLIVPNSQGWLTPGAIFTTDFLCNYWLKKLECCIALSWKAFQGQKRKLI